MLTLGLHTALGECALAIARDGVVIAETSKAMPRGQDAHLPRLTHEVCQAAGVTLSEISRFGVVTGPGSFTGIRVGVAFARGLALANDVPCLGITTLEAALPAGQQGSAIVVLTAQKRPPDITFWVQTFRSGVATALPQELPKAELLDLLQAHPHMVFGTKKDLTSHLDQYTIHEARPEAERVALLAAEFEPDTHPARPTYARAPDAALPGQSAAG